MEKNIAIVGLVALILGAAGGYGLAASTSSYGGHAMPDGSMMRNTEGMLGEMNSMMHGLAGKTGDAFDRAFLAEMIVHHEGAVEMAESALQNAKHQELKDMAQNIITAQNAEIAQMREWQQRWYGQ